MRYAMQEERTANSSTDEQKMVLVICTFVCNSEGVGANNLKIKELKLVGCIAPFQVSKQTLKNTISIQNLN